MSHSKRIIVAAPLALAGAFWCWLLVLPWPITLRWRNPERTAFMEQRIEEARAEGDSLRLRQTWVPLEGISNNLQRAVIVAEDGRFRDHGGVDWLAVAEELDYQGDDDFSVLDPGDVLAAGGALRYYLTNRDEIRGRSTITQQLAKNLYFSADRSSLRKVKELVVAKRLEWLLPKDRILEIYLNVAEWGPGIFGAEAAAQHYFGRSVESLTQDQAAALAATLPHPLTSNPAHRPGRMAWRRDLILRQLRGGGPPRTVPLEPPQVLGVEIEEPELEEVEPELPPQLAPDTAAPPPPDTAAPPPPPDTTAPPDTSAGPRY